MKTLYIRLQALAVFRSVLRDPVMDALCCFMNAIGDTEKAVGCYGEFVARLYAAGGDSLAGHIRGVTLGDENAFIRMIGKGETPPEALCRCVREELAILQEVADLTPERLGQELDWEGYLPGFTVEAVDLSAEHARRCEEIATYGYGIFARHRMFYVNDEGSIVPVRYPDPIRLADLVDYQREKQLVLDNTLALLEGRPAANILLTGDAGTGKSSTVKAVGNELYHRGLRILEVRKEQLHRLPGLLDTLWDDPLKFIIFIDDLSFRKDDEDFATMKAILEGSVSARSQNVVIYATSNRRHLVQESFSDREGDDIHRNDTLQEMISLSERFGLQITFQKPNRQTYLDIVRHLAQESGIAMEENALDQQAERFALGRGGRSARAARQFVDSLRAQMDE